MHDIPYFRVVMSFFARIYSRNKFDVDLTRPGPAYFGRNPEVDKQSHSLRSDIANANVEQGGRVIKVQFARHCSLHADMRNLVAHDHDTLELTLHCAKRNGEIGDHGVVHCAWCFCGLAGERADERVDVDRKGVDVCAPRNSASDSCSQMIASTMATAQIKFHDPLVSFPRPRHVHSVCTEEYRAPVRRVVPDRPAVRD
jgi:hypothetical protein